MIATHSLSPPEFAAVANGVDTGTLQTLVAAQQSYCLMFATAVLQPRAHLPRISAAIDTFSAAQARASAEVARLCREAWFGAWAASCLDRIGPDRGNADVERELADLGGYAAAAALRAGMPAEVWAPVRNGHVLLPGYGVVLLPSTPARSARVEVGSGSVTVQCGRDSVAVPLAPGSPGQYWRPLRRLVADCAGRRIRVILDDLDPHRDCYRSRLADPVSDDEFAHWQQSFTEAWRLLVRHAPVLARQLEQAVLTIVPLRDGPHRAGASVTSIEAFGCLAMTTPISGASFAETLVHEYAHSILNTVTHLRLLHRNDPAQRYYAPWRPDPRPVSGLLHGAFAFVAVAELWQALRAEPSLAADAENALAVRREELRPVLDELASLPVLTEDGRYLVAGLRRRLHTLAAQPVAPSVLRQAAQSVRSNRIRWRCRNISPDPGMVSVLADAFVRTALKGELVPAADEYDDDLDSYAENVVRMPERADSLMEERPELVRAVYRAVVFRTGRIPQVATLAQWLERASALAPDTAAS